MPTMMDEVRTNNRTVTKQLREAGVSVQPYGRNPLYGSSASLFTLSLDPSNVLRLWAGTAKVNVIPSRDKSVKQAVVQVTERGRTIRREIPINFRHYRECPTEEEAKRRIGRYFIQNNLGVSLPSNAEFSVVSFSPIKGITPDQVERAQWDKVNLGTMVIQGKVRATRQNFLVGRDEKSQFVAMLPRKAKSVKDAHESLRPAGVPRTALRQGEWFFVPANRDEKRAIANAINRRGIAHPESGRNMRRGRWGERLTQPGELEEGSSHHAPCSIRVGSYLYATGIVYDNRPNRHGSLMLSDWHRVIRNRERVNSAVQGRSAARWD